MQPLIEEQPQPGQKLTGLHRPHEQFVYGCTHACPSKARSVCCPYVSICTELAWPRVQTPHMLCCCKMLVIRLAAPILYVHTAPTVHIYVIRNVCARVLTGDRQDKKKTSAPRDMLHLHYYLSVVSQEYGDDGAYSSCYGESQHGPVTADGALVRRIEGDGYVSLFSAPLLLSPLRVARWSRSALTE